MTSPRAPVRIAGGGPSGLACAIALAEAGHAVEVHEALAEIGGRFDGDHQTVPCFGEPPHGPELLASVGLGSDDLELAPLHSAVFLDGRDREVHLTSDRPYSLMLRRGPGTRTLEGALARRARTLGVRLVTRSRLDPHEAQIVATGASAVDGVALERLFSTTAADRVDVLFDTQLTPGGYAYLFIHSGEATAGVAALAAYKRLENMMEEALRRFARRVPFDVQRLRQSSHFMNFAVPESAVHEGRLYVGEAAGFQDYLFGLGIQAALVSGRLAGRALASGQNYDRLWRQALRRRMLLSAVDRFLYERLPGEAGSLLDRLRGGDLRVSLERLQADAWTKRLLLLWVQRRWLRRHAGRSLSGEARDCARIRPSKRRCAHNLEVHLCRPPMLESAPPAPEDRPRAQVAQNT